ncbi:MAG: YfiR family protein [Verrucomicrobia bacterium]|nr:YfiR family protein [Verrucomicrobiota bacterium]
MPILPKLSWDRPCIAHARIIGTCAAALIWAVASTSGAESTATKEYRVKAAFLYNFTKFVEFPPDHFGASSRPITIGIMGHDPFGAELQKTILGRKVDGRDVAARVVTSPAELADVDVLFFPAGEERRFDELRPQLSGAAILTVGESSSFAAHGGAITFLLEGDKVRFSIDLGASAAARLKLSAQLLKLATSVRAASATRP